MDADQAEEKIKQGGQIYMPPDSNVPIVTDTPGDGFLKDFMFMPCLAMDKVPVDLQPHCVSIIAPDKPELLIFDNGEFLEAGVDYNPQNPETFDLDASYYVLPDIFFPDYAAFESVSTPRKFQRLISDGKLAMALFEDTDVFRNAASFDVFTDSTQRTFIYLLLLISYTEYKTDRNRNITTKQESVTHDSLRYINILTN